VFLLGGFMRLYFSGLFFVLGAAFFACQPLGNGACLGEECPQDPGVDSSGKAIVVNAGEACLTSDNCYDPYICQQDRCVKILVKNDACLETSQTRLCGSGLKCLLSRCQPEGTVSPTPSPSPSNPSASLLGAGSECSQPSACASKNCITGSYQGKSFGFCSK